MRHPNDRCRLPSMFVLNKNGGLLGCKERSFYRARTGRENGRHLALFEQRLWRAIRLPRTLPWRY